MRATIQAAPVTSTTPRNPCRPPLTAAPTAGWFAELGDVQAARGQRLEAERAYARADAAWTTETPEPREHALFLAMHGRDLTRAVTLAEQATRGSRDILSSEAHAWAAFQAGDLATARRQIDEALRTGSRLRRLRYHAAAIYARAGEHDVAREHLRVALASPASLDLAEAAAVEALVRDLGLAAAGHRTHRASGHQTRGYRCGVRRRRTRPGSSCRTDGRRHSSVNLARRCPARGAGGRDDHRRGLR